MKKKKKLVLSLLAITLIFLFTCPALAEMRAQGDPSEKDYTLEQVVVLSRHNLRAPLSSNGSVPQELTPHSWTEWTANSSELTMKGGVEETAMGEYFRKWLDKEGLIAENSIPEENEVRFNARDKQRCRATARYFAAGLLPLADISVEYPGDANATEDFMEPVLHYYSDAYAADATAQVAGMGGDQGFEGLSEEVKAAIKLIMDTVDMEDSEAYKEGKYGDLLADESGYTMEADKEPDVTGAIKTASQVADALVLQYYEEPDALKAAFGHELTDEDWKTIGGFLTKYLEMRHSAPLIASNITNPLLKELESELKNEERKFTFFCAHDCTVMGTLSALGVEPYSLPESIETRTPIGVKLLFERWRDQDGEAWYRVNLVYRSTEQIRNADVLTLNNPPMRYDLQFEGIETNQDGLISEEDLFALFDRSIAAFDNLEETYGNRLAYWDPNAPAMQSIIEFVKETTDETSEGFIPEKDRIAVFDMDGTLTCETFFTYYDTCMFIDYCLKDHPERVSEELKEAAREIKPGYTAGEELARNFAKAYKGMTVEELYDYAVEFGQKETESFNNMRYIDGFYLPMVEVVKYLYENGFTIYVVSGTERTTTRAIVDNSPIRDYVDPAHVIGTEFEVKVKGYESMESNMDFKYVDGDELVFTGGFIQKNLNANKSIWIEREIGRRPVLAFGNSGSDTSMMNYALDERNPYPSAAYMVVADDDVREWGTQNWEEKSAQYEEQGYVPISMKNDFAEIYPAPISRADTQYKEPETAEEEAGELIEFESEELEEAA